MSRGPGRIQRGLSAIFEKHPAGRFTIRELASRIYPGEEITISHTNAVGYTLRQVAPTLGLTRCRTGKPGQLGWAYRWGKAR